MFLIVKDLAIWAFAVSSFRLNSRSAAHQILTTAAQLMRARDYFFFLDVFFFLAAIWSVKLRFSLVIYGMAMYCVIGWMFPRAEPTKARILGMKEQWVRNCVYGHETFMSCLSSNLPTAMGEIDIKPGRITSTISWKKKRDSMKLTLS